MIVSPCYCKKWMLAEVQMIGRYVVALVCIFACRWYMDRQRLNASPSLPMLMEMALVGRTDSHVVLLKVRLIYQSLSISGPVNLFYWKEPFGMRAIFCRK